MAGGSTTGGTSPSPAPVEGDDSLGRANSGGTYINGSGGYGGSAQTDTDGMSADQYQANYEFPRRRREDEASGWGGQVRYDPNGDPVFTGAANDVQRYQGTAGGMRAQAQAAQQRQAPTVDYSQSGYDRMEGYGARLGQDTGTSMMLARAMGYDSAAKQQAAIDANRLYAQQMSAAASARGPAAMAMAQQNAAASNAAGQSNISAQSQVAASQERAGYTQQYMQAVTQQRAQDLQAQGLDAQQAQYQAGLEMQQNGLNDQYSLGMQGVGLGYERLGYDVNQAQQNTNMQMLGLRQNMWNAQSQLDENYANKFNPFSDENVKIGLAPQAAAPASYGALAADNVGAQTAQALPANAPNYGSQMAAQAAQNPDQNSGSKNATQTVNAISDLAGSRGGGGGSGGSGGAVGAASKIAGIAAMMFSDERAKKDAYLQGQSELLQGQMNALARAVGPMEQQVQKPQAEYPNLPRQNEIQQTLDNAPAYTWEYKPGFGPSGRQAGPIAQDLQKTELGRSMVQRDPQTGYLQVDPQSATRFSMAAAAHNNQRINRLEAQGNALARAMQLQSGPDEAYLAKAAAKDRYEPGQTYLADYAAKDRGR